MDSIGIHGKILLHETPTEWNDNDFQYWWCPTTDKNGNILVPARISDEAKAQRLAIPPVSNLITNTGIALLLANMSVTGQGSMEPFFQILSIGNGAITGVTRQTSAVAGDGFATNSRKAPASFSVTGFSTNVVTNFASGDVQGTWTNLGIYGYNVAGAANATTSSGTGALMTAALFSFVKGASAYALSYVLTLSN